MVAVAGAMFSPVLASWTGTENQGGQALTGQDAADPLADGPLAGGPEDVAAVPTASATPSAVPVKPTPSATPAKPPATRATTPRPAAASSLLAGYENEVLALTNVERAKAGCAALKLNANLRTAARNHSSDMARNNYFSHTGLNGSDPGTRMKKAGYDTSRGWAENIAAGYRTPAAVMQGWMNSAGHRANILNCGLKTLGVGAARVGSGQIYWTQDFGRL